MLSLKVTESFFDRPQVAAKIDRATRESLRKAGSFTRTTARRSIKPAGKRARRARRAARGQRQPDPTISRPGQPPRLHTRSGQNLRLILFGFDPTRSSVIVGPVLFKTEHGTRITSALEHGGPSFTRVGSRRNRRTVRTTVRARPFMGPALKKETPRFPSLWANTVK